MNLIKRNQIDRDDGATVGQNDGTHWQIIQRMLLRLQLTACQSKNERDLKKAKWPRMEEKISLKSLNLPYHMALLHGLY